MSRKLSLFVSLLFFSLPAFAAEQAIPSAPLSLKLGVALSLSGEGASIGKRAQVAVEIGREDLERSGKLKIDLCFEDTRSMPRESVSVVNKLISTDHVRLIIGPDRSSSVLAVVPITERVPALVFSPIAGGDNLSGAGKYFFRNREPGRTHGIFMADLLLRRGIRRVSVLTAQSANAQAYIKAFRPKFEGNGGEILFFSEYLDSETDFRTLALKALLPAPQAVYISCALGTDGAMLVKELRASGYKGQIFGTPGLLLEEFIKNVGPAGEGLIFSAPLVDRASPQSDSFIKRFKERYGEEPDPLTANTFDAVNILGQAVLSCGSDSPDCVREFLLGLKNYPGVGGKTTFDERGDVAKPVGLMVVRGGKCVEHEE